MMAYTKMPLRNVKPDLKETKEKIDKLWFNIERGSLKGSMRVSKGNGFYGKRLKFDHFLRFTADLSLTV